MTPLLRTVFTGKLKSHEVYDYITSMGSTILILWSLRTLSNCHRISGGLRRAAQYEERAIVMQHNVKMPTRPLVRIVYDENKKSRSNELDQSQERGVFIVDTCEV